MYGFAPRVELPAWVPRQPRSDCVGRELACTLIALDAEAGVALLSPRLLALRRAREAIGTGEQVHGSVVSVTSTGIVVDLGGARSFVPLAELSPEALLAPPEPTAPWWGYVTGMADTGPLLSQHAPQVRASSSARGGAVAEHARTGIADLRSRPESGRRGRARLVRERDRLGQRSTRRTALAGRAAPGPRRLRIGSSCSTRTPRDQSNCGCGLRREARPRRAAIAVLSVLAERLEDTVTLGNHLANSPCEALTSSTTAISII